MYNLEVRIAGSKPTIVAKRLEAFKHDTSWGMGRPATFEVRCSKATGTDKPLDVRWP